VRVQRCFAFVDLSGFTSFADHEGDEQAVEVLATLRSALREISARRGVRVVKWLGDGAMLSSMSTDAVVATTLELRCRLSDAGGLLPTRAGISSGPVIMFEGDDYIGRPVNVAARLSDAAGVDHVLATLEVVEGLPPWVEATPDRPRVLRGLDDPVPVVRLGLVDAGPHGVVDPVCGLRIPRSTAVRPPSNGSGGSDDGALFCSEACATAWPVPAR
jgi:adenylate cyclase